MGFNAINANIVRSTSSRNILVLLTPKQKINMLYQEYGYFIRYLKPLLRFFNHKLRIRNDTDYAFDRRSFISIEISVSILL